MRVGSEVHQYFGFNHYRGTGMRCLLLITLYSFRIHIFNGKMAIFDAIRDPVSQIFHIILKAAFIHQLNSVDSSNAGKVPLVQQPLVVPILDEDLVRIKYCNGALARFISKTT